MMADQVADVLAEHDKIRDREIGQLRDEVGWDVEEPNNPDVLDEYIRALEAKVVGQAMALQLIGRSGAVRR